MKLSHILKTLGRGLIKEIPGGGAILGLVNAYLDDDKKITEDATGNYLSSVIETLPDDQKVAILSKEFEVDITDIKERHDTLRTMLVQDAINPHSTRAYIAKQSFHVVGIVIIIMMSMWSYAVAIKDSEMVNAVMGGWQFVLALIGPLIYLLYAYFGILKKEHEQKLNTAAGVTPVGVISKIIGAFRK